MGEIKPLRIVVALLAIVGLFVVMTLVFTDQSLGECDSLLVSAVHRYYDTHRRLPAGVDDLRRDNATTITWIEHTQPSFRVLGASRLEVDYDAPAFIGKTRRTSRFLVDPNGKLSFTR